MVNFYLIYFNLNLLFIQLFQKRIFMEKETDQSNTKKAIEKLSDLLKQRPPKGQFRDQLFWLVDIIHICKSSGNLVLIQEAKLMENVLNNLSEFLKTGETEALNNAAKHVEQFARIVKATVAGSLLEFNVFLSYATKDTDFFKIPEVACRLEEYPDITKVFYWEQDSGQNIIEYMEENVERSKVFVHFC
ncbi:MAG: hypothetical protein ACFE8J_07560, partial [Candidatus Heimdallarchaeota archaeon]